MNPLILLFGFLGALFVGGGSSDTGTTPAASAPPATTGDDTPTSSDTPDSTANFIDITEFGTHHGTSSHTHGDSLHGGRTAITTEAMEVYNGLRDFLGQTPVTDLEDIGKWAFANGLTNNAEPYGEDLKGVGLYYGMQGAKVGWIADDQFDPQILADIQRTARLGEQDDVMGYVEAHGLPGFADYLANNGLVEHFVNTLKMEPHYGGYMHGRTHGGLQFEGIDGKPIPTAHDLNHLTVLSHDQLQPFMNDTFDYPQWPALDAPEADVANYFQSMILLSNPRGEGITASMASMSDGVSLLQMLALPFEEDGPVDEAEEDTVMDPLLI